MTYVPEFPRVSDALDTAARVWGDQPALKHKHGGLWQATTWSEYRSEVRRAARGLMQLGVQPGEGVTIIGQNCPQWFVADLAAIHAGAVPAGIYTTNTAEQCHFIAHHCDARVAVVDDQRQLAKFKAVWAQLPALQHIVLMHGADDDPRVHSWEDLLHRGDEVTEAALSERLAGQGPKTVCTLIYTSGTTGHPKGVMITHDNITWTARAVLGAIDLQPGDQCLSYLPLSHVAEQIVSLHGPMYLGGTTWFAESLDQLGENLREVRPHYFLGVPRVWEKMQAKIAAAAGGASPLKQKIARWARATGLAGGYALQHGQHTGVEYAVADRLVFSKVRQAIGLDRCRMAITAAAPIAKETLEFFLSLGLPIYEVYGMSECTGPATVSTTQRWATGRAGFVLPGAEIKIAPDGEICMRGRHVFAGYCKDAAATAEALDSEGWLHSGDIGAFDDRGLLQITDRKKDLLITAGGENIAPQLLESLLKSIPVIAQAVVIGDARKYLSALLTLDPERVLAEAKAAGSPATDPASAAACPVFAAHLQRQIDNVNAKLAQVQTIKRWTVLPGEFTIDGGELTPTMKIKRKVIRDKYASQIEAMYAG